MTVSNIANMYPNGLIYRNEPRELTKVMSICNEVESRRVLRVYVYLRNQTA
jgi:hypothetical protein